MVEQPDELILKFLADATTPQEKEALDEWASLSPENRKKLGDLKKIWDAKNQPAIPDFDSRNEWRKLQAKLQEVKAQPAPCYRLFYKIAASLALIALANVIIYQTIFKVDSVTIQAADITRSVSLPDGTTVLLNKQSRITYASNFANSRNVTLRGEAFFEVAHDAERPFVIGTGEANVRVLGTSFNVRAYENDSLQEVFVSSGKVRVTAKNKSLELRPGDLGVVNTRTHLLRSETPSPENQLAWKTGKLVFRKTSLVEVVHTLEHYFQISITLKNPVLEKCRFTSSFTNPTLDEVIEAISLSMNLNVMHQDTNYTFDGEGCGNDDP